MNENFYPNVSEVVQQAGDQNTTISLRIKESTRSLFEILARRNNLSLSSVINNLLDEYAENYIATNLNQAELNQQSLRRYVETAARKAGSLDPETLLHETIENYHPEALFEQNHDVTSIFLRMPDGTLSLITDKSHMVSDDVLIKDFTMWAMGRPTHFFRENPPYIFFGDGVITALPPTDRASIEINTNELEGTSYVDLYLPAPKWLVAISIISAFYQKNTELNNTYPLLGDAACRHIVYLANTIDNLNEFAKSVAALVLRNSESRQYTHHISNSQPPDWSFIIIAVLENLGGQGTLKEIYAGCKEMARQFGRPITSSYDATIRGELHRHSSDSDSFDGKNDYFSNRQKGNGVWTLRPGIHADLDKLAIIISER